MKPSIGVIPQEIQAFILSKLDGKSAANAKKVNRLWNEIITGLETSLHFWLRCCLKELSPYILVELTRLLQLSAGRKSTLVELSNDWNNSLESKLPWMFWQEVYAEYCRSKYICRGKMTKVEFHFFPLDGEVSCLHEHDNIIYSGHKSGAVICWTNNDGQLTSEVLYRHHRRVTCITGLDMVRTTADILNGEQSHRIVSCSRDATLMVFDTETEQLSTIKHYTNQVNCVRCWGRHFVAAANRSMIQGQPLWKYDSQSDPSVSIEITLFSQSASNITAVAFWEDTILSGDELGNVFQWTRFAESPVKPRGTNQEEMTHLTNLNSPIKELFLLSDRVVCFTGDGKLHICKSRSESEAEFVVHNIFSATLATPEYVTIRGSILAIGCRAGSVFLYHMPSDSAWDNLDLTKPDHTICTGHEHVNGIIIGDDGAGPFVVIATERHMITWVQFRHKLKKFKIESQEEKDKKPAR